MSRDMTSSASDEIVKRVTSPIILYEGEFDGGTVRMWTGVGTLPWNGQSWVGRGEFLGFDTIAETTEVVANGVKITLNGQESALVAVALAQCRMGFRGTLWLGFLDESGQIVPDPFQIFGGLLDVPTIQRNGDNSIISVSYESRLIGLTKPNDRRYTPEEQKIRFPTDTGFDFVAGLQDAEIVW